VEFKSGLYIAEYDPQNSGYLQRESFTIPKREKEAMKEREEARVMSQQLRSDRLTENGRRMTKKEKRRRNNALRTM
jgi:hypothetical protein